MELFSEDTNQEEQAKKRRNSRIEQMKREKRRQMRRRKMIKKYLPYACGALGILIAGIVLVVRWAGTEKPKGEPTEIQQEKDPIATENLNDENNSAAVSGEEGDRTKLEDVTTVDTEAISFTAIQNSKELQDISFTETADTKRIYSEDVISSNAILVNADTNFIAASKDAGQRISPASMTKVLTILVAAEAITEHDLEDTFTITREITDYAYVNDCSAVGFAEGEEVKIRDLFYGTILPSGADAAVALAVYTYGSQEAFVDKMNEKLQELGIAETTHFTNCVGLYAADHYSTVYDMAVIMKAAVNNTWCKEVLSKHTHTTEATEQHAEGITISNWFLRKIEDKDCGGEVLCAKTGYVLQSKNCAVSYGIFGNNTPYICVTAGSTSSWRCIYDHVEIYNQYIP